MIDLPTKTVYFAKEIAVLLGMKVIEVNILAKYLKVPKIYGAYRFSQADIERMKKFIETGK